MEIMQKMFGTSVILVGLYLCSVQADMTQIVNVCCGLGTDWAKRSDRCDDYYEEIAAIKDTDQRMCRQVLEVCCIKSKQDEMCTRGVTDGLVEGGRCAVREDQIGAVTYKECCSCCQMGLAVKQMGMECTSPAIGSPCDNKFMQCCVGRDVDDGSLDGDEGTDNVEPTDAPEANTNIDECSIFGSDQLCSQICVDTPGSYRCDCSQGYKLAVDGRTCYRDNCPAGFAYNTVNGLCEDIDECVIGTHNCYGANEICRNHRGSYLCECDDGFHRNRTTKVCEDIDECARRMDTCTSSQRCENTIGSFACRRITPCGTGWTLDEQTQECRDQDECALRTHNCGTGYECFNIEGSFRCNPKRCPDGFRFNSATSQCERFECSSGFRPDSSGLCVDVNECEDGVNPCRSYQTCQNSYGSYRCINSMQCRPGYEVDTSGQTCVDIDECTAGTHDCRGMAECINRAGSYICSCPQGYRRSVSGQCEDKNECQYGNVCPSNAVCENTPGSFRCVCDPGFEQIDDQRCIDINECEDPTVCTQGCTNLVGSFVCTCESGYKLAADGRTCIDIDECRLYNGPGVCAGNCINTPGSYMCSCPSGWRIMGNGRSCQDIDECQEGTDRCGGGEDVMCFNTRGSHRCPRVTCPSGFSRSALGPRRNSVRCKRLSFTCRQGDQECLTAPLSLSYNFLTFPTNVKVPTDLFSMSGPYATQKKFDWYLNVTNTYTGLSSVTPVRRADFDLNVGRSNAVVQLLNRIEGPQDVELMLTMKITDLYSGYTGYAISKIYLYVTSDRIM